jgi:hypothetical protein
MANASNYLSKAVSVTTSYADKRVREDLGMSEVSGIQNNTTGIVTVKFNGGDGEFQVPVGALWEPYRPILGTITIKGVSAGTICVLG